MANNFFNQNSRESSGIGFDAGYGIQRSDAELVTFIKDTYKLFAATMLAGTVGAYIGVDMAPKIASMIWLFIILEIGLLIGINFVKHKSPVNLMVVFAFAFVSGLTLGPLLYKFLAMPGGAAIIANAFAMTTIIFGGLSLFAIRTKSDFTSMGKPLMIALIVVMIGSIVNIFLGNPILHIVIQGAVVMIFSFFIIYDTQNIIQGNYETPIDGAVGLYLDFLNLFTALLQILGIMGSDD